MPDEPIAAPSPATETVHEPIPMDQWTPEQTEKWRMTGEEPTTASPEPKKEESAPSQDPSAAPKAETAPESEAGHEEPSPGKGKADGEQRKKQLAGEIQELLRLRAQLRQEIVQPAGAKPAESPPAKPQELKQPPSKKVWMEANGSQYQSFEEAEDAYDKLKDEYYEKLTDQKAEKAVHQMRQELLGLLQNQQISQHNQIVETTWAKRVAEASKRHPDFQQVIDSVIDEIPEGSTLDVAILQRELGTEFLYFLGNNPTELQRIIGLNPLDQAFEIAVIEKSLSEQLKVPPTKNFTAATKPPYEVGGKNAAPQDEALAAVADGDFERFKRLEDSRDSRLVALRKG